MKLDELLNLPWTVLPEKRTDDGEYFVARIRELPGLVATGGNAAELEASLLDALRNHLEERLEHGDEIELPRLVNTPKWRLFEFRQVNPDRFDFQPKTPGELPGTEQEQSRTAQLRDRDRETATV